MHNVSRTVLFLASSLLSAAAFADDAEAPLDDSSVLPEVTLSAQAVQERWEYASRWRPTYPVETLVYSNDSSRPGVNVDFRDSDALARVSRLRNLSFLTFAEIGRARLFLGVDESGIVGLHLRAVHRLGDERYLEVIRMPYLKQDQPDLESD